MIAPGEYDRSNDQDQKDRCQNEYLLFRGKPPLFDHSVHFIITGCYPNAMAFAKKIPVRAMSLSLLSLRTSVRAGVAISFWLRDSRANLWIGSE